MVGSQWLRGARGDRGRVPEDDRPDVHCPYDPQLDALRLVSSRTGIGNTSQEPSSRSTRHLRERPQRPGLAACDFGVAFAKPAQDQRDGPSRVITGKEFAVLSVIEAVLQRFGRALLAALGEFLGEFLRATELNPVFGIEANEVVPLAIVLAKPGRAELRPSPALEGVNGEPSPSRRM